jgi:hypothetical protein
VAATRAAGRGVETLSHTMSASAVVRSNQLPNGSERGGDGDGASAGATAPVPQRGASRAEHPHHGNLAVVLLL